MARSLWFLVAMPLVLHLWPNPEYTYFGDEFYYLACSRRLAAGYVDHPPLSVWILRAWTTLAGDSVFALRVLPAVAGSLFVLLTVRLVQRFGGGFAAQFLAAVTTALAPLSLAIFDFYSMNAFEVVLWTAITLLVVQRVQEDRPRLWLAIGLLFGLGALNKHTVSLLAAGLALGVLSTPLRRDLRSRWLWMGALLAAVLFLPNLAWQIDNDWPSLEFYRNAHADKNLDQGPSGVLIGQALVLGPLGLPLVLVGLVSVLCWRRHRAGRAFFFVYAVLLASMITSGSSRPDRIAGGYAVLIAAGSVAVATGWRLERRTALRRIVSTGAVLLSLALVPISLAAVPTPLAQRYANAMGALLAIERGNQADLPLWLNYRRGWPELVTAYAEATSRLDPAERSRARIYADSYGRAGALEHFGRDLGLPPVICSHNSYYQWSEDRLAADVYLTSDLSEADRQRLFDSVEVGSYVENPSGRRYPVYVARGLKVPFEDLWPRLRVFR